MRPQTEQCQDNAVGNGRESAVNRSLDGSTYPGEKLVPSSHCKNNKLLRKTATYTFYWQFLLAADRAL